jgi:hypothetical protein
MLAAVGRARIAEPNAIARFHGFDRDVGVRIGRRCFDVDWPAEIGGNDAFVTVVGVAGEVFVDYLADPHSIGAVRLHRDDLGFESFTMVAASDYSGGR